jgi:uncharacterized protein
LAKAEGVVLHPHKLQSFSMPNPIEDAAGALIARLRADLRAAMREKRPLETSILRTLIAAIDHAQAVPDTDPRSHTRFHRFGEGANEAPRRSLTAADLAELLGKEIAERTEAAAEMDRHGRADRAERLRGEAAIIAAYLDERHPPPLDGEG